jgi:uncharacterized protein (TIGR03086 family)
LVRCWVDATRSTEDVVDLTTAIGIAAEKTRTVVANADALLEAPTPCSEFTVSELAAHMSGFAPMSIAAGNRSEFAPAEWDPEGWPHSYLQALTEIAAAWSSPDALEGAVQFAGDEMPAAQAASITVLELLVHGWDFARATGQSYSAEGELAGLLYGIVAAGRPAGTERGFFGPAVTTPDDAPTFDRALALSGRDPAWSAG